jgi:Porin PorA
VPITVQNITQTDADRSDDDVAVWITGSCVVENADGEAPPCVDGEDPRLISASEDTFATDRVTALAVPNDDYVPSGTVQHEGLVNKWPFDAEKKTYPYWDGTVGAAVDAVYQEEEEIEGVETYRYQVNIDDAPIEIAEGVSGTYTNEVSIWVEPKTGAILNQSQDQQRYLDSGAQVLNLQAEFTDDQVKESVSDAESNMRKLALLTWAPIIGFSGGALAILAGVGLLLTGRRRDGDHGGQRELAHANA